MTYGRALVELIEAGVRAGRPDEAAAALERLSERTRASGTEWALGIEARCRALLSDDESCYRESIEQLARSRAVLELARSRLLYGEWLRRENRRTDAREQLRAAHESFSQMGAAAFAERARRELLATGETARRITPDTRDALTPQEIQVARLARDGHTNPEIGAQLFISPRTVEYHLRKVFRKLDVSTRKELRAALADGAGQAVLDTAWAPQLPHRQRGQQRRDDEAEHEGADLAAERHEQDEQRRDRHALGVRLAGHPPAEQALSEQVERGPAEDHRRADPARRLVGRGDQQIAATAVAMMPATIGRWA